MGELKYDVRTKLIVMNSPDVFQKKNATKVFTQASKLLLKAGVHLRLEDQVELFNYAKMVPRGMETAKWLFDFGSNRGNGWWERKERVLQILLIPPVKRRTIFVLDGYSETGAAVDEMWCVVSASPEIGTLSMVGSPIFASAVMVAHQVSHVLGAGHMMSETFQNVMDPHVALHGSHLGIGYRKESVKQMRSWFVGKKFEKIKDE